MPSAATLLEAFEALFPKRTLSISSALVASPSASFRAFLQSIIGASVLALKLITIFAVISAILYKLLIKMFYSFSDFDSAFTGSSSLTILAKSSIAFFLPSRTASAMPLA